MTDPNDYLRTSDRPFRLKADVLTLMMKGAGYAAIFCILLGLAYWAVVGVSRLLPEDSKMAPDPTPEARLVVQDLSDRA